MMLAGTVPTKVEGFAVAARPLHDHEMNFSAIWLVNEARQIYQEDQGVWPSFEMFLGFHIGKGSFRGRFRNRAEHDKFVKLVLQYAKDD